MLILENLSLEKKLEILSDAAKYDAACTSSGVDRRGARGTIGNTSACGICHSFAADGRCISLLKILMTNECVYDCKYCINRRSNDIVRTAFTPEEICTLTIEFYRRNYIEGLFLSSGVAKSPDATMERIYETLYLLRQKYRFRGYVHVKGIPGASPEWVGQIGYLTDRMSVNLELPTADSLHALAPHKTRQTILRPIRQIQRGMEEERLLLSDGQSRHALPDYRSENRAGSTARETESASGPGSQPALREGAGPLPADPLSGSGQPSLFARPMRIPPPTENAFSAGPGASKLPPLPASQGMRGDLVRGERPRFVPAGQSTQMIIGATPETDYQIVTVAEALYHKFDLRRVFYSAYIGINEDSALPAVGEKPPLLREHRLYQADWLLRFYGFTAGELLDESRPNFNVFLDPKCDWAVRHLGYFPVEVNRADYAALLRVPGIGVKSAQRICKARRSSALDFADLKKMGVVLKRAHYFITCKGKMMQRIRLEEGFVTSCLMDQNRKKNWQLEHGDESYQQLSLFDDKRWNLAPTAGDVCESLTGQL
ncbi:MAG: putative DNA modification/repair radical SAM protein [Lachnospiraceae bacterium]|nr:putative DNA modification/repair radical SAM protein [Lachnospiraceae bacterium]